MTEQEVDATSRGFDEDAPLRARRATAADEPAAVRLAAAVGVQGVYVCNHLQAARAGREDAQALLLEQERALVGMAWFGKRGNLIVLEQEPLPGGSTARAIVASGLSWRIVLGPAPVVQALARQEPRTPFTHRRQLYYSVRPEDVPAAATREDVRLAVREDLEALARASLQLNEADLHVDAGRVSMRWLRQSLRERIAAHTCWVLGPIGAPACKLDLGSEGPAGVVIEGVFTVPEARGRHLASGLVASVSARLAGRAPLVCLHVAAANDAARRAYERAGMQPAGECELMLRR